MTIKTSYGKKKEGLNQFVIIAPHGAGDDLKTGILASRLAKILNSFLVVNNVFFKPSNKRAKEIPKRVEDFNKLRWGRISNRYFWKKKKKEMKEFYDDISLYCDRAKEYSKIDKAVAIYIHGMNKTDKNIIDIGCGLKNISGTATLLGSFKHKKSGINSGDVTLQIKKLKDFKKLLSKGIYQNSKLNVTIGRIHAGWSGHGAIQFHKKLDRDDTAFQLEFGKMLRGSDDAINYCVNYLSKILKQIFK